MGALSLSPGFLIRGGCSLLFLWPTLFLTVGRHPGVSLWCVQCYITLINNCTSNLWRFSSGESSLCYELLCVCALQVEACSLAYCSPSFPVSWDTEIMTETLAVIFDYDGKTVNWKESWGPRAHRTVISVLQ